jgi:hypothetical protein
MQIEGVSPGVGAYGHFKVKETELEETSVPQAVEETADPPVAEPQVEEPQEVENGDGEKMRGVIRLLLEGHFKGVADVRLRINFYEELAAIEAGELKASAEAEIDNVLAALDAVSGPALATTSESEEGAGADVTALKSDFEAAVEEAKGAFLASEQPSVEILVGDLENAFAAFVESLWNLATPVTETIEESSEGEETSTNQTGTIEQTDVPEAEQTPDAVEDTQAVDAAGEEVVVVETGGETVPEPQVEEAVEEPLVGLGGETEGVEEPIVPQTSVEPPAGPDWAGYIAELEAAFAAAMAELRDSMSSVSVLPPLSEPSGKGAAYEKFLAIYNEMRGIESESAQADKPEAADEAEPVDETA